MAEYKAQGRESNEAAILYDSIMDNWNVPEGYYRAEKEREKEAELQKLRQEHEERVERAKTEAAKWAAREPEDRASEPLKSWIWGEQYFNSHEPTEEEIEAKRKEFILNLQTQEEYEQLLINEIERDISYREERIRG